MRGNISTLHCDGADGFCDNWSVDYYEQTASSVGVTRITATESAPGWLSTADKDFCPSHRSDFPSV